MEPQEYFDNLKANIKTSDLAMIEGNLKTIEASIQHAHKLGQKNLVNKFAVTYKSIIKEQIALNNGVDRFMYKSDIQKFIKDVRPKNSVKIIELERYPRVIPDHVAEIIIGVKDLNIFSDFCVVYTDFVGEEVKTKEEKKFVQDNKDPIVFGFWKNDVINFQHERFYFIADWIDEYCDLTFTKMVESMTDMGVDVPYRYISNDINYVNRIIEDSVDGLDKKKSGQAPKNFFDRLKDKFSGTN